MKLSLTHVVVVLGLVTGSMACAFYLGFFSGQRTGYENALSATLPGVPRMPVDEAETNVPADARGEFASTVYAKLSKDRVVAPSDQVGDSPLAMPALEGIKSASESPVVLPDAEQEISVTEPIAASPADAVNAVIDDQAALPLDPTSPVSPSVEDLSANGDVEAPVTSTHEAVTLGALLQREGEGAAKKPSDEPIAPAREIITKPSKPAPERSAMPAPVAKVSVKDPVKTKVAALEKSAAVVKTKPSAATEPPVPTKSPAGLIKTVIPGGWYAQVSAPTKVEDADSLARKLRETGFPVIVEHAQVRGEQYFRVLVGPEDGRKQGQVLVEQLKKERFIRGEPFLRMVR